MLNTTLFSNYIKHILNAKSRHGTHSPFVYRLVDEVIYDFSAKEAYADLENLRKQLLKDERVITVTDLGAGSHINNQKQKAVKSIAKNALKPKKLAQLLYRLAKEFNPKQILELGTCLGLTSAYFAKALPQAKVVTMEGCPQTAQIAQENWQKLGINNVEVIVGNFDETLAPFIAQQQNLDFVFIDGNHRKEATLNYFNLCLPKVHEHSVLVFDDIYWSKGMQQAWEQIKAHPQVSVSIDLFWIGLVFFRKGQARQDFKIRF
ncbi:SAM-dependent methyltransferase [Pelobium manganitolerans]|uniref:SAM-dependent methyltransferase n=1 Tax=Pelobium manganitolerans TaxID=1842495 RepID=A0A419S8E3_9SPHI|nr:class I SAM-dependent methyltransferase [Pelobium manganitolerans]RKD18196.1 SAM-dependent methyltransferase [Pelobium manganitolerans]